MTFVGHPVLGALLGVAFLRRNDRPRGWIAACVAASWLPDVDVLLHLAGGTGLVGHRGFTHSLGFAFTTAVMLAFMLGASGLRNWSAFSWRCGVLFFIAATHSLSDAMTVADDAVPLFWPVTAEFFRLPWQPLVGAPIKLAALQDSFWSSLYSETIVILIPASIVCLCVTMWRLGRDLRSRDEQLGTLSATIGYFPHTVE